MNHKAQHTRHSTSSSVIITKGGIYTGENTHASNIVGAPQGNREGGGRWVRVCYVTPTSTVISMAKSTRRRHPTEKPFKKS